MDVLVEDWLHELEMEEPSIIQQCQVDTRNCSLEDLSFKCLSPERSYLLNNKNNNCDGISNIETPQNVLETTLSDNVIPFLASGLFDENANNVNENSVRSKRTRTTTGRAPGQAREHILAERKRRERLNQRLIALSALIPGLKKMDKASILEDAITYVKELKDRVEKLEGSDKKSMSSGVFVSPAVQISTSCCSKGEDVSTVSSEDTVEENFQEMYPNIEVKISSKNVLVRVHHEKSNKLPYLILSELGKLRLNVISSFVIPFGDSSLDITAFAEMEDGFSMSAKDLVKNLSLVVMKIV